MDRFSRQILNRETRKLTNVMTQMDLIDIYRPFHPNTKEYIVFSAPTYLAIRQISTEKKKE